LMTIQDTIFQLITKCFGDVKHYVILKRFLIDIIFEHIDARKIQIVLHVKKSIDEHMEFVDLPITQLLLAKNRIFKTCLAQLALDKKVNVITDPINEQTINRIVKYAERGFPTVVHAKGQYHGLGHPMSRIVSIFDDRYIRYFVEMKLSDVYDVVSIVENPYLLNAIPRPNLHRFTSTIFNPHVVVVETQTFSHVTNTRLFDILYHRKFLLNHTTTQEYVNTLRYVSRVRGRRSRNRRAYGSAYGSGSRSLLSYGRAYGRAYGRNSHTEEEDDEVIGHRWFCDEEDEDDEEEYETVIRHYQKICKIHRTEFKSEHVKPYRFKNDESNETYTRFSWMYEFLAHEGTLNIKARPLYPFYTAMPICDIPRIRHNLFFNQMCTYFLHKHGCAQMKDGSYEKSVFVNPQHERIVENRSIERIVEKTNVEQDTLAEIAKISLIDQ
jgi:hypothetical protein